MRDQALRFSNAQAITATANSENVLFLGALHANNAGRTLGGASGELGILLTVTETFVSGGSSTLDVKVSTDDAAAFGGAADVGLAFPQIAKAALVAGAKFFLPIPSNIRTFEEYARLVYTVGTANFTAGKLTAEICDRPTNWYAYAENQPAGGY